MERHKHIKTGIKGSQSTQGLPIYHFWRKRKFWKGFSICLFLFFLLGAGTFSYWVMTLDISKLQSPLAKPTYIYDQLGNQVSELTSSRIDPVSLSEVPQTMRDAIVDTEDRRFYQHKGIDIWSILRALVRDLRSRDLSEGGSTITQQLAKNLFLPSDKTFSRKFKEAAYAVKIEMTLSKDQILEEYLNQIYFGEGQWGIRNAARYYFGKNVKDLTLEESALLAGLPQAPSVYSPLNDKDKALERRNTVLSLMKDQNDVSDADYQQARSAPIVLRQGSAQNLSGKFASYVDYVIEEAISRYGFTEDQLLTGGLNIYTEMNPTDQQAAENVYHDNRFFPSGKSDQIVQSGIVLLDQHSGGIRGLVGYRGDSPFRSFNHATQLKRQPGSAIKPLAVYGPALEKGYTPNSRLYDGPLNLNGYSPRDYDYQTRGQVTMDEALQNSWNIPAVWLLNEIGLDTGLAFAQKAGLPLTAQDRTLSLALGGIADGVSPLQMAQAYSAFANLGTMYPAYAITKITSEKGYVLAQANPQSVTVTSPQNAYTMTRLLENVVTQGTGKNAALERPTAGKTGSVELPATQEFSGIAKGQKDVWFIGYTPELTAAVWMGYDKTDRSHYLTTSGGAGPAVVFHEVLSQALKNMPVKNFDVPPGYQDPWKTNPFDFFDPTEPDAPSSSAEKSPSGLKDKILERFGFDPDSIGLPKGKAKKNN